MADKGKLEIQKLEPLESEDVTEVKGIKHEEANGISSEKATARHLEVAKGKPYWDSPHVIGASRRNPSEGSFNSGDEVIYHRPNVIVRLWRHYKRHWKLYAILTVIGLAIALPIA
jgi:hypothetical protein